MIVLLALLAVTLSAVAFAAVLRAASLSRNRMATRMQALASYGYAGAAAAAPGVAQPATRGVLTALARRLGDLVADRVTRISEADLRRELVGAGFYGTSARLLLGYRVLAAAGLAALGYLLADAPLKQALYVGCFLLGGWMLPLTYVRRRARARAVTIDRELPNLIDQVVVTLEAGVGFSSSLQIAASRMDGPLGDEMRVALQEQRMGVSLSDSLLHLRDRIDSPNVKSFARAVVQGERLGVSIGTVMRDLALDMRKRRRQSAEERAQKAPVKILIPLVFCILPALFIVVLAPALLEMADGLT